MTWYVLCHCSAPSRRPLARPVNPSSFGLVTTDHDDRLDEHAIRNRSLDRELAQRLGRPEPACEEASAGFLRDVVQARRLAAHDEERLVRRAKEDDPAARAQVVESFLPLIASVARTYRTGLAVQRIELLQEGVVGLLRALERFDPDRGVPFWGYAAWWVRQAMQQLVAELTGPTVLSDRALRHLARLKEAHADAVRDTGRRPTRDELVERMGLSAERVRQIEQRAAGKLAAAAGGAVSAAAASEPKRGARLPPA
jgi:DNA-directed RNA polymerase sigma subunit (sigma70/sigma32)